jgi:ankyrin repeat protein
MNRKIRLWVGGGCVIGVVLLILLTAIGFVARAHMRLQESKFDMSNPVDRLRWAAGTGRLEVVHECIDAGADINDYQPQRRGGGTTALAEAASLGHIEIMQVLLDHGADVEAGWRPPICDAVQGRSREALELLLDAGADINHPAEVDGLGPAVLQTLARGGDVEVLTYCQSRGLRVLPSEAPQLMLYADSAEMITRLIELGFNPDARSGSGWTQLHSAAFMDKPDWARALVEGGATVDIEDYEGVTPLHVARSEGHVEVVEYLESVLDEQ